MSSHCRRLFDRPSSRFRYLYRLFSRSAFPVVTRDALCNWMATKDRSWHRTVQIRIGRTWKGSFLFFSLLNCRCCLCVVRQGKFSHLLVEKWSCRCYMRLSSASFFRPCFSEKLPTTLGEQCCSLVVVQRIFQHIKKIVAPLGSVFSLSTSTFSFSFLVAEQVRLFLLPFSFRPWGDWSGLLW